MKLSCPLQLTLGNDENRITTCYRSGLCSKRITRAVTESSLLLLPTKEKPYTFSQNAGTMLHNLIVFLHCVVNAVTLCFHVFMCNA